LLIRGVEPTRGDAIKGGLIPGADEIVYKVTGNPDLTDPDHPICN
jgi:hypothetical protein